MQLSRKVTRRALRRAFTLMEVLVVVAIIVVLAGIATISFRYLTDSKYDVAKVKMKKIESAAAQYKMKHGDYPDNIEALAAGGDGAEAYLEAEDIIDPWGQEYVLDKNQRSPTGKPKITSAGEPGRNAPISNW